MKNWRIVLFLFLFTGISFIFGCKTKDEEGKISTDVVNNPQTADSVNGKKKDLPVMTFTYDQHDFGEIIQGEKVQHNFEFTNTGKSDLIITAARASCGCTVPEYPEEPIRPGEKGIIKVNYDSKGRKDAFNKTVTITANTFPSENKLQIKGVVIVPEEK